MKSPLHCSILHKAYRRTSLWSTRRKEDDNGCFKTSAKCRRTRYSPCAWKKWKLKREIPLSLTKREQFTSTKVSLDLETNKTCWLFGVKSPWCFADHHILVLQHTYLSCSDQPGMALVPSICLISTSWQTNWKLLLGWCELSEHKQTKQTLNSTRAHSHAPAVCSQENGESRHGDVVTRGSLTGNFFQLVKEGWERFPGLLWCQA